MTPLVGHVVRMTGGQCAPDDMGGGWVCRVWGQAESRIWPSDTTAPGLTSAGSGPESACLPSTTAASAVVARPLKRGVSLLSRVG